MLTVGVVFLSFTVAGPSFVPRPAIQAPGQKIAVVVGVSAYLAPKTTTEGGFSSLRYAHADASKMSKWLASQGWKVSLLQSVPGATATQASKNAILATLSAVKTSPGDTVLFYFSGHGLRVDGQDHLVPGDGKFKKVGAGWQADKSSMVSYAELESRFKKIQASKRFIIVDACRDEPKASKSGAMDSRVNQAKLGEIVQVSEFGSTSSAVMYSCKPGERSWESEDFAGGVFTHALLTALSQPGVGDAEGNINLISLNTAVRTKVKEWAGKSGKSMSPNMETKLEDPIELGKVSTTSLTAPNNAIIAPTPLPTDLKTELTTKGKVNPKDGQTMLLISGGTFLFGEGKKKVYLDSFWIGEHPVTVKEYRAFCKATNFDFGWKKKKPDWLWKDDHPMVNVTWNEARAYAKWVGGDLPTQAQWEKAARGLDGRTYPWGNTFDASRCTNSVKNPAQSTVPVGSNRLGRSPYGVFDMAGNVYQWCLDWYSASLPTGAKNPVGPASGTNKVLRGGGYTAKVSGDLQTTHRHQLLPTLRRPHMGFRVAMARL